MSIDKWLEDSKWVETEKKRNKIYKSLSQEQKKELKEKSIKKIVKIENEKDSDETDDFLDNIIEFKDWLNNRKYLKGDKEKIEVWISNLYRIKQVKIKEEELKNTSKDKKQEKINAFRKIPLDFLDEKIRIIINKKVHGYEITRSDKYYLSKFKKTIQERLKELKYYEILKTILEL